MCIRDRLNIPSPTKYTSNRDVILPFVFLADDAFPLKENIVKPYGHKQLTYYEKIYNYRICRGRRVVENAFGILSTRCRCLQTCLQMNLESVDKIVLACCALHNLLRKKSPSYLRPSSVDWEDTETGVFTEGEWRNETISYLGSKGKSRYQMFWLKRFAILTKCTTMKKEVFPFKIKWLITVKVTKPN